MEFITGHVAFSCEKKTVGYCCRRLIGPEEKYQTRKQERAQGTVAEISMDAAVGVALSEVFSIPPLKDEQRTALVAFLRGRQCSSPLEGFGRSLVRNTAAAGQRQ